MWITNMSAVRSFIMLGQYGIGVGMMDLVKPLSKFGLTTVHPWYDNSIITEINLYGGKIAVIGYSLGANQLGFIGTHVNRIIDLGIGYDPSRKSPQAIYSRGEWIELAPRYKKLICYYNPDTWFYGGAKYDAGEVVTIKTFHFSVPRYPGLHQRTVSEVEKLANG